MIDLTLIIKAIILLLIALITRYLVPYLKAKYSAETLEEVTKWVRIAVEAAEMIYNESGMGEAKKQYVLDFLESKGFTLDAAEINNLIESEVHWLHK